VQLRNTSNALTLQMSSEQIRLQVSPKLFRVNSWILQQAVNSRLFTWQQKMHGSQRCWGELAEPGCSLFF